MNEVSQLSKASEIGIVKNLDLFLWRPWWQQLWTIPYPNHVRADDDRQKRKPVANQIKLSDNRWRKNRLVICPLTAGFSVSDPTFWVKASFLGIEEYHVLLVFPIWLPILSFVSLIWELKLIMTQFPSSIGWDEIRTHDFDTF